jgi:hypothetical protein
MRIQLASDNALTAKDGPASKLLESHPISKRPRKMIRITAVCVWRGSYAISNRIAYGYDDSRILLQLDLYAFQKEVAWRGGHNRQHGLSHVVPCLRNISCPNPASIEPSGAAMAT